VVHDGERHAGGHSRTPSIAALPSPPICCAGDLVEDVVVRARRSGIHDADVEATIERHRGGSAANTAAAVARLGGTATFLGAVGTDATGDRLVADLSAMGVTCRGPRRGRTGTIVVIVAPDGTRTMYSDRGAAADADAFDADALAGAAWLHVPFYGLAGRGGAAFRALLSRAADAGIAISLDPSSVTYATAEFVALVRETRPDVVFCNAAEAAALGVDDSGLAGARTVVVKGGSEPVLLRGSTVRDIVVPRVTRVIDTTGAGDAFAGGFILTTVRGGDAEAATRVGIAAAARVIGGAGADAWSEEDP
jgi:sugar/nucleoside kinase (ribokinase family)